MKKILVLASFIISLVTHASNERPVQTVSFVDLNQYLGEWYEIATIPMYFQRKCAKNVKAQYSMKKSGLIKVENSCETKDGFIKRAKARAKVVDQISNSKLKVTFVKIYKWIFALAGNYWIIDLDEDYSYAVVGDPTRKYGWILSRERTLSPELLERAKNVLNSNGYDLCQFMTTIQEGGATVKRSLCDQ